MIPTLSRIEEKSVCQNAQIPIQVVPNVPNQTGWSSSPR